MGAIARRVVRPLYWSVLPSLFTSFPRIVAFPTLLSKRLLLPNIQQRKVHSRLYSTGQPTALQANKSLDAETLNTDTDTMVGKRKRSVAAKASGDKLAPKTAESPATKPKIAKVTKTATTKAKTSKETSRKASLANDPKETTITAKPKKAPTHQVLTERDQIPKLWDMEQAKQNGSLSTFRCDCICEKSVRLVVYRCLTL
jgi:hypothetical protein